MLDREKLLALAREIAGADWLGAEGELDRLVVSLRAPAAHRLLAALKAGAADTGLAPFELLVDLTAVDYLTYPEPRPTRFAVVYQIYSFAADARLRVKAYVPEAEPELESVTGLWPAAGWLEREAGEMFGIIFLGHPDPRKLLLPEDFAGFPLRKDYPLAGRGERENFPPYTALEES